MQLTLENMTDEFKGAVFNHACADLGINAHQNIMVKNANLFAASLLEVFDAKLSKFALTFTLTQSLAETSKENNMALRAVDFQGTVRILMQRLQEIKVS